MLIRSESHSSKLFVLAFYEKKHNKVVTNEYMEIDLLDLESFGDYEETSEFSKISSKLVGNKTIIEWFAIESVSFWWFIYPVIYPTFNEAVLFINRLLFFLDSHPTHIIKLHGNYDKLSIIKEICILKNIKLKISKKNYFAFLLKQFAKNAVKKAVYKKITNQKHKKRLNCYTSRKKFEQPPPNLTVITSPGIYRRDITDYESGEIKRQEFILQPILNLLYKNNKKLLCFDLDYTFRGDINALIERLESQFNWVPIEILLSEPKSNFVHNSIKILHNSFEELKKNNIRELFVYKEIHLWEYLKPSFEKIFFEPYLPTYLNLIEKVEKFFMLIKPQVIIQVYETGPYAKSFEIVAKKLGIKTIGIQHGIIYETHPDYMHEKIQNKNYPLGNPLPDLTFVFGEYYKKILTEQAHYVEDKVAVIGNPSFYNIEKIKQILSKEGILKKYHLSDKKIILVPTSFRLFSNSKSPDDLLLDILYNGLKDNEDIIVLVRPHPGDYSNIESLLEKQYPSKNFRYSKGSLIEDIFVSDIVVTTVSSVGIDAVIFEKPIIFVNIAGNASDSLGGIQKDMIESDVAISVYKDDLISKILSIQKGQLWISEKSAKRREFMHSYFNYGKSVDLMKLIYTD